MKILFISDLHLDPERPDIQACFDNFIHSCLSRNSHKNDHKNDHKNAADNKIDSLYILGDLFEVWVGDDASIPVYEQAISQLKQLSTRGINVYVMHGNRDFLMGSEFERLSGCKLIPDLYHLQTGNKENNQTLLLSHGDIFCTDDIEYIKFREMVRNPIWQKEFLAQSISERFSIARTMRQHSMQRGQQHFTQEKASEITDVNQKTVEQIMSAHQARTLIHGHTHRPAVHEFKLNKHIAKRIVLADWQPDANIFEISLPGTEKI